MSGADGYLNLKTYRTIARMLMNAGLDHRVETMKKHYKIVVASPMGERSFLLGHGPNPKETTEREGYRQIDKLIAEVRVWREAHVERQDELPLQPTLAPADSSPSFDLALYVIDDEPRVLDTDLAAALGMADVHKVRPLIRANFDELRSFGDLSAQQAESTGGRPATAYHLNEEQALLICLLSRTERARQVRAEVIRVFTAWRHGALAPSAPALPGDMRQVIGGITKSVVRAALSEMMGDLLPDMVAAHLAKQNVLLRHGKTAGQIWDRHGLPKLKSASVWLGNRLAEMGCQIEGRGERGAVAVRLFDPDKSEVALRNGLLLRSRVYVAERQGQRRLRLMSPLNSMSQEPR